MQFPSLGNPLFWWPALAAIAALIGGWRWRLRGAVLAVLAGPVFTVVVWTGIWLNAYLSSRDHTSAVYRDVFEGVAILIGMGSISWIMVAVPVAGVTYLCTTFARAGRIG